MSRGRRACFTSSAQRPCPCARRAPPIHPGGVRCPGRSRGGYSGRRVLLRVPDSSGRARGRSVMTEALAAGSDPGAGRRAHGDAAPYRGGLRRRRRPPCRPHRCAGHGGQVLMSSSTASLVELELTDLGEHRFKDLGAPERVYQLGDASFPAAQVALSHEPARPATTFLGRERSSPRSGAARQGNLRLVTLTGPGGTGKTRLAVQAAAEAAEAFPDGIWWVPLASLRNARLLISALAQALTVEEEPGRELAEGVAERLSGKQALLILDNAEHCCPMSHPVLPDFATSPARRSSSRAASGSSSRASASTRCRRSRTRTASSSS